MNIGMAEIKRQVIADTIAESAIAKDKEGLDKTYNMKFFSLVGLGKNGTIDLINSPFILLGGRREKEAMLFLLDYCLNHTEATEISKKCYITQMLIGYAEGGLVDDVKAMMAEYPEYTEAYSQVALAFARVGNGKAYRELLESMKIDYEAICEDTMWSYLTNDVLETAYLVILTHITDKDLRMKVAKGIVKAMQSEDINDEILSNANDFMMSLDSYDDVDTTANKILTKVNKIQTCMQQLGLSYEEAVAFIAAWRKPELHAFILAGHQLRKNYGQIPVDMIITICGFLCDLTYPLAKKLFAESQNRMPFRLFEVSQAEINKHYQNVDEKHSLKNLRDSNGSPQTKQQALSEAETIFKKRMLSS